MSALGSAPETPLEAGSPFELRVDLAKDVSDTDAAPRWRSGDIGFLHSFTTGSAVDGPGIRLVAWTTGCGFRCAYCHNPDTWKLHNGIPVPIARAVDELRKYRNGTEDDEGRLHALRRRAAHAASLRREAVPGRQGSSAFIRRSRPTVFSARSFRTRSSRSSIW